ncbi:hypothetical protein IC619_006055 [Hazenella sp. IB182353]|uniref:hypothetical protein n=1 Tax=Polycladospora coralii TaxID=2771432 RepID=UPI0017477B43|nr:hypothetical protein [Polycladospora coralii]MBS7530059.1 hypothetical protein [Polycladospora coralii]
MEKNRLQELRKKQVIYLNTLFILLVGVLLTLILTGVQSSMIYILLGITFLIPALSVQIFKKANPLLELFPAMKELHLYEREKLKKSWRNYYTASSILQVAVSLFFFSQVIVRDQSGAFIDGIPLWYLFAIPLLFLILMNNNLRLHAKKIDLKTEEQLQVYAYERRLFAIVFASVALVMIVLGSIFVILVS